MQSPILRFLEFGTRRLPVRMGSPKRCDRHHGARFHSVSALDRYNLDWVDHVNRSGEAYLTPAVLDGRWMVRVSVGAAPTEREHVEDLWALIRREAERSG